MFVNSLTRKTNTAIEENRANLQEALDNFKESLNCKNEALAAYFYKRFKKGQDVDFGLLNAVPDHEKLTLPTVKGGTIYTVKHTEGDKLVYDTEWSGGATLTKHRHSDCSERIEILEGQAYVIVMLPRDTRKYILEVGQALDIGENILHQVTALKSSKMRIEFVKTSNNG